MLFIAANPFTLSEKQSHFKTQIKYKIKLCFKKKSAFVLFRLLSTLFFFSPTVSFGWLSTFADFIVLHFAVNFFFSLPQKTL